MASYFITFQNTILKTINTHYTASRFSSFLQINRLLIERGFKAFGELHKRYNGQVSPIGFHKSLRLSQWLLSISLQAAMAQLGKCFGARLFVVCKVTSLSPTFTCYFFYQYLVLLYKYSLLFCFVFTVSDMYSVWYVAQGAFQIDQLYFQYLMIKTYTVNQFTYQPMAHQCSTRSFISPQRQI